MDNLNTVMKLYQNRISDKFECMLSSEVNLSFMLPHVKDIKYTKLSNFSNLCHVSIDCKVIENLSNTITSLILKQYTTGRYVSGRQFINLVDCHKYTEEYKTLIRNTLSKLEANFKKQMGWNVRLIFEEHDLGKLSAYKIIININ